MSVMDAGFYVPGRSAVHRLPAGVKLLLLLVAGALSFLVRDPVVAAAAVVSASLLFLLAGLGLRVALAQLRPLRWLLLLLAVFHVLVNGWERAVVVTGVVAGLVLLAGLVTTTSRTEAIIDALVAALRPLRRLGVDPDRVSLLLALSIRSVPVVGALAAEVRDAQWARGLTSSPRAFAVPFVIRALRHADATSEALVARGVDS